jgi:hypothetical protein
MKAFQQDRLAAIATTDRRPIRLAGRAGSLAIHLLPFVKFSAPQFAIDLETARAMHSQFAPLQAEHGYSHKLNFDGVLVYRGGSECHGYTQLFRDSAVEAVSVGFVGNNDGNAFIPSALLEESIVRAVPRFIDGLQKLAVPPPFAVMISLHGIAGARYAIPTSWPSEQPERFTVSSLLLPEAIIDDFGTHKSYERRLCPSLDTLWNAVDHLKSAYFDNEGHWVGNRRR